MFRNSLVFLTHCMPTMPMWQASPGQPVQAVNVKVRTMGREGWKAVPAAHLGRAVWQATLPAAAGDFEYFVEAQAADGKRLRWPITAPDLSQTVVVH